MTDNEKIIAMVEQLDGSIPKEGARVKFDFYGDSLDESYILANARGYLRLGVEFLKAGVMPPQPKDKDGVEQVPVKLDYLTEGNASLISFETFERDEAFKSLPKVEVKTSWWEKSLIVGVLIAIAACILIGFITVVRWLL